MPVGRAHSGQCLLSNVLAYARSIVSCLDPSDGARGCPQAWGRRGSVDPCQFQASLRQIQEVKDSPGFGAGPPVTKEIHIRLESKERCQSLSEPPRDPPGSFPAG